MIKAQSLVKQNTNMELHIRQSQTYSSFRRHLKTHYFISAHLAT